MAMAMADPDQELPKIATIRENKRREHGEFQNCDRYCAYKTRRLNLSGIEKEVESVTSEELQQLIASTSKRSSKDQSQLRRLRKALSESEINRETFIRSEGAIHGLVGALTGRDVAAQLEAAGCLVNLLAASNHKMVKPVVRQTTAYFIQYLHGTYPALKELCCLGLGNVAADCAECCYVLKAQHFFDGIKSVLDSSADEIKGSALFALSCYIRTKPEELIEILETCLITPQSLCSNLANTDPDIVVESSKLLFYLSARLECQDHLLNAETVKFVIEKLVIVVSTSSQTESEVFLPNFQCQVVTYLVRTVAGMLAKSNTLFLPIPSMSFQDWNRILEMLLSTNHLHVSKESLWLIGNMTCFLNKESVWFDDVSLLRSIAKQLYGPEQQAELAIECFCNALTLGSDSLAALCCGVISEDTVLRLASSDNQTVVTRTLVMAHLLLEKNWSTTVSEAFRKVLFNLQISRNTDISSLASAFGAAHL